MNLFLFNLNILLALLWAFMWGSIDLYTLAAGFGLGYLAVSVFSRTWGKKGYGTRGWNLVTFFIYFIRILIQANLQVAKEIITPGFSMTPRLIRFPIEGMTDLQVTSVANAITLTPGTLAADVSEDGKFLYVHCMYAENRAQAVRELDGLRDRMMREVL